MRDAHTAPTHRVVGVVFCCLCASANVVIMEDCLFPVAHAAEVYGVAKSTIVCAKVF